MLVDPELAVVARARLAETAVLARSLSALAARQTDVVRVSPRRRRLLIGATVVAAVGVAVALAAYAERALLHPAAAADRRSELDTRDVRERAASTVRETQPLAEESPRASAPTASTRAAQELPPFAWPEVRGAAAYRVEVFRGKSRVFLRETTRARVRLPREWRFRGRVQRLAGGRYRWVVRPLRARGTRVEVGDPIVDASFVVRS